MSNYLLNIDEIKNMVQIQLGGQTPEDAIYLGHVIDLLKKLPNSKIKAKGLEEPSEQAKKVMAIKVEIEKKDIENIVKIVQLNLNAILIAYLEKDV